MPTMLTKKRHAPFFRRHIIKKDTAKPLTANLFVYLCLQSYPPSRPHTWKGEKNTMYTF